MPSQPPGPASSNPSHLTMSGGKLYFQANDQTTGRELWTLDVGDLPPRRKPIPAQFLDK